MPKMYLLFTDWCEYYAVCEKCYYTYLHLQWSGSTYDPNWREASQEYLEHHQATDGRCEFCDPVIGNGGWIDPSIALIRQADELTDFGRNDPAE